ncbi:thiol reductant ABC exporter subunit CydD [Streptomyces sp. 7-21]|uniref:thiol reductant ABC exporter subunit CydD n=1 Tax=Streptomyces sp. 7-21 TaxID=2802283 RepID=UPI00191FA043|nr:thiol reductant ABC exporter subunit CydD [Streptomyces sp. 7-21]MBL1066182.1 thiol reductant ABC exporter subunit CydD [Streptomyces sp. 7-21]
MKPVDPRLLRHARATRGFLAASVALGAASAGLLIAQAVLLARLIAGAFADGLAPGELLAPLLLLLAVTAGRALAAWLTELAAHRTSAAVKSQLRARLVDHAATRLGPGWLAGQRGGELTALATRGIDALDGYFSRYLPQLCLAVVVPAAVLAKIAADDLVSAAIIAVTLPLIPVFAILIGWATQAVMDRQWRQLSRLAGHFVDVVAGLPTLKVFGRARAQAEHIQRITGDYRRATMRTLRVAFLSSFALELIATVSVALVAVGVGLRLVHGELTLQTALTVLILAPEAYLPLRQAGAQYHAAQEGLSAAGEVFAVLETPGQPGTDGAGEPAPDARRAALELERVRVRYPGRADDALAETSLSVAPGEVLAVTGPSGGGKSTLLAVLLGFVRPASGRVRVGGRDLAGLDLASWHRQVAWVPQRPYLFAGTIADNVRLARPDADDAAVAAALRDAAAGDLALERVVGEDGGGLSAGQRQRVALARALLADRPVLLLDEPTAALDGVTEAEIVAAVRRAARGRTVILVTHRPALLDVADRVFHVKPRREEAAGGASRQVARPGAGPAPRPRPAEPGAGPQGGADGQAAKRFRVRLGLAAGLGTLALASAVGLMATSGWLISRAWQQPPLLYLMVAVTATRGFGIGRAVFRYAERLLSHDAVLRLLAAVRTAAYRRLERLAPAGLPGGRRGDLLARFTGDVDALQDRYLRWLLPAVAAGTVTAGAVGFTAWLLPEAAAVLAAGLLAAGVAVPALVMAVARRAERNLAPARGELSAATLDVLTGTAELTVAGALPARLRAARAADARLTALAARSAAATALGGGLSALVSGLTVTAAAWLGAVAVADGRLDGVWLATVVLVPLAAFEAVAGMPLAAQYRQRVAQSAARLRQLDEAPAPVREPERPLPLPADPFPLQVSRLTARYPGAAAPALRGVDLELTPGRRIAVVGPSGAGKTTLAHCLLRFLDPDGGSYTLGPGAVPAARLRGDDVRRLVGLCAQDAHVFDSTLRENLRLARPDADEDALRAALASARLLEWVDSLPDGLDTAVGEHGARLSGGQRQRLALARALLAGFPVLVLDEPAEHVDEPTADALTADLLAATADRATVLITHRLAGLKAADEVIVLADGRVVQRGPYQELARADGPLRRLLDPAGPGKRAGELTGERTGAVAA